MTYKLIAGNEMNPERMKMWLKEIPGGGWGFNKDGPLRHSLNESIKMMDREPLVQEVINLTAALESCDTYEEVSLGKRYVIDACRKLVEFTVEHGP